MTRTRQLMVDASAPDTDLRPEDEPTILDYARVLWGGRWVILALTLLATVAAVGISLVMTKSYTAKATLMPLGLDRGGGLNALSGALSGALAMDSPGMKLMAVLQSRTVADDVVGKLNLEPALADGREPQPTRAELIESFQKRVLKVSASQGMIVVKAVWRDPELSAKIANTAVLSAARYLNEHSISTSFQILDEAVPPPRPSSPKIALNTAAAFVLSGFASVCLVFIRQYLREVRRAESARAAAVAPSGAAASGPE
jgi:uncharacterized protein involved in exopolysaccharide biosynthesis